MHTPSSDQSSPPTSSPAADREAALARRVEAGIYADAVLTGRAVNRRLATDAELRTIADDGRAARDELVLANTGLVWLVVNPVAARTGLDRDELAQEGHLGLVEAVARFDARRGGFATFALIRIRLRVGEAAVTGLGGLGLPVKRARVWWQARGVVTRLESELARTPRVEEVAAACVRPVPLVRELLAWRRARPLLVTDDVDDPRAAHADACGLDGLVGALTPVDRVILEHRFGLGAEAPRSYAAVARVVGLSAATVRRRERAVLERLRREFSPPLSTAA